MLRLYDCDFHFSQHIEHYAEEVREAAEDDEYMENRVHISMLYSEPVEYRAECVEQTACDEQEESAEPQRVICRYDGEDYAPAHTHVAYHREYAEFFEIYRR